MNIPEIQKLLEQQQEALRELNVKVDFINETMLMLQFLVIQAGAEPEDFQELSPEEWMKLISDKRKTIHQKMELLAAARKRNQPPKSPPGFQN
jgi:hypothetical protein